MFASASGGVTGTEEVGGLAGKNSAAGVIHGSEATGHVSAGSTVGGLVGINDGGTIEESTAAGEVTGTTYVGGLVGWNTGAIAGSGASGDVAGGSAVGGLAGVSNNSGASITDSEARNDVSGSVAVGGLVGEARGSTIHNSNSIGCVTVNGVEVNELVGLLDNATVTDSTHTPNCPAPPPPPTPPSPPTPPAPPPQAATPKLPAPVIVPGSAASYRDMASHWADAAVTALSAYGLFAGYPDGSFAPEQGVSLLEVAVVFGRLLGLSGYSGDGEAPPALPDWAAADAGAAHSAGVLSLPGDGARPATRGEVAAALYNWLTLVHVPEPGHGERLQPVWNDTVPAELEEAVAFLVGAGIVHGYPDGTFRADSPVTRAEFAALLHRALQWLGLD